MKVKRYALAVVAIGVFLISTTFAAESPAQNWTGLYVGINGGYGWGDANLKFRPEGSGAGNLFSPYDTGGRFHKNIDGGIVGGHAGYNYQLPFNVVVGLEASVDWADVGGVKHNPFYPTVTDNTEYNTKVLWFGTATPKIGYALSNILPYNLMPYIKGGLVFAGVKSRLKSAAGYRFSDDNDYVGWTIGGGIEYKWRNWIFGAEYNYIDLGTQHYGGEVSPNTTWPLDYKVRPTFGSVLTRVSYEFK